MLENKNATIHASKLSDVVFIMVINVICWHFNIYEHDKFMLISVEYEKMFITSSPEDAYNPCGHKVCTCMIYIALQTPRQITGRMDNPATLLGYSPSESIQINSHDQGINYALFVDTLNRGCYC